MQSLPPIHRAAAEYGLIPRGGFVVDDDDAVPGGGGYLLLFGNAGGAMWRVFRASKECADGGADPLNRWSARVGNSLAKQFQARALFPFNLPPAGGENNAAPVHLPFLRWAKKAEGLHNSRLGMLIHPKFGLWHAYRFALVFAGTEMAPAANALPGTDVCARCDAKPCRPACPVNAFTDAGYDVQSCYDYLATHPNSSCMQYGCQARMACPVGEGYRYEPAHAAFHMRAFVTAMAGGLTPP